MRTRNEHATTTMSVLEASKTLGIGRNLLMDQMRKGNLKEIGTAIKTDAGIWRYYIYRSKVARFIGKEEEET